jgi:hypothetical protein
MAEPMSILGVNDGTPEEETSSKTTYWATLSSTDIGSKLVDKVTDYDQYTRTYGLLWLWRRSYYSYYKNYFRGGKILRAGDVGQYRTLSVNHYHSIVSGLLTLITSQEPAFDPQAVNSSYKAQAQCMAAKNILDYKSKYAHLSEKLKSATEKALMYGEGFIFLDMDMNAGSIVAIDPVTKRPIYDGDVDVSVFSPADVIRDYSRNSADSSDWYILRKYVNKWDLVAIYPDLKEKITDMSVDRDIQIRRFGHSLSENEDDVVCQYILVHKKTPAVPNGRIVKFLNSDTILFDGALPFDDFPVYRIVPANQEETSFGYTVAFDLLAIQEAIDKLVSVIVTNQMTFGVQNIVAPLGTKLSPQQLMDGLNLILTDMRSGVPQVLEMCKTPPEIYQFIEFLIQQMELISGLNSVSRGVAPENLKSGTALAFVQSQAIQANSGIQKSYSRLIEDVGTGYLKIVQKFPKSKKIQALAGPANATYLNQYNSGDVADVSLVTVESGNPLTKTTAGRIEVAQNLLQYELLKTPEEFMAIVETGQLGSFTEGVMSELMHIREENEALRAGQPCKALFCDNHPLHIKEHMVVINSVDIRNSNDPAVAVAVNHIMEHIMLWQTTPANVLAGLGIQPPPASMSPSPLGPPPPGQGNPAPSAQPMVNATAPGNPTQEKADQVNQPKPPAPPKGASPQAMEAMKNAQAVNGGM